MGYRSDVCIALTKKVIAKNTLTGEKLPEIFSEMTKSISEEYDAFFYYIDGVKWYESYKEIDDCMYFLRSLETEDYGFLRLGEALGDVEELGHPWDFDMYAQQTVSVPFDR